jgi:hypothetical protein
MTINPIMGVVIFGMFWRSESKNNKIYPMWDMFYQWPKILEISNFETFTL